MKKKILVVDDEAGFLKALLLRLNNAGYDAFGGEDGQAALELARRKMPDLIILDVMLPKLDGDAVLKLLRRDPKLKRVPVFLISAVKESLKDRALASGADHYFPKPLEMGALLGMVERYLSGQKGNAAGEKILVVDDDGADRERMVAALEREGYPVMAASNMEDALREARRTLPDLVIVDVVTQDSNTTGYDICRKIKTTFQPDPPSVLIVTGKAEGVSHALADRMGASAMEIKSLDMAHVVKAVRNIFTSKAGAASRSAGRSGDPRMADAARNFFLPEGP